MAYRFENLSSIGEAEATLTYETDDTLELTETEGDGSIGKKRKPEVCGIPPPALLVKWVLHRMRRELL